MRGEVWTVAGPGYASKPRPAVVVQSDGTDSFESTIVCLLTTDGSIRCDTRVAVSPDEQNGLKKPCFVMADKIVTMRKSSLGKKLGELSCDDMGKVDEALRAALGI